MRALHFFDKGIFGGRVVMADRLLAMGADTVAVEEAAASSSASRF